LRDVPNALTEDLIIKKLRIMCQSLKRDFAIQRPRIALLGLNPHAGDNGLIGNEEQKVMLPAINRAQNEGILAYGPYPADGFFGSNNYTKFDGILAMYHDQGMVPFKTLAFDSGVNFTAGLPVIRTSPAHGTAYDIAGKDLADESSMRAAVYLACDIFKNRKYYDEASANPMKSNAADNSDDEGEMDN
jgi:4-hydroxythreonine-4-phosphate dehydrogenase